MRVGELCEYCAPVTTSPHVSHFHGWTRVSTVVPGPSHKTILNTTGTCSTVHYMPCPRQCSATESWRALALTLHQIFALGSATQLAGSFACLLCCMLGVFHAPKAPCGGNARHVWDEGGLACRLGFVVLVCSWQRLLADRHLLPFPSLSLSEGPPSRCFGPPFLFLHGGGSRRPKH